MLYKINIVRPYHKPDFFIETTCKELADVLNLIYAPFICEEEPSENSTKMFFGDNPPSYEELQMIENAMYDSTIIDESHLAIHAATLEYNGRAFLFSGYTEAGKSTLTSYLCNSGINYFSDDLAIIERNSLCVRPFPRPIQLREGGFSVLEKHSIDLSAAKYYKYGGLSRHILNMPQDLNKSAEIGGIFFIERSDINDCQPVTKSEAFTRILKNLYIYIPSDITLIKLIKQISEKPVFHLKYKDMDFVKQWIMHS